MIWFTRRQFRLQAAVAVITISALGVLLVITGRTLADLYSTVAACRGGCATAVDNFLARASGASGPAGYVRHLSIAATARAV